MGAQNGKEGKEEGPKKDQKAEVGGAGEVPVAAAQEEVQVNDRDDSSDGELDVDEGGSAVRPGQSLKVNQIFYDFKETLAELKRLLIDEKDEEKLFEFFKKPANANLDLFFIKLDTDEEVEVYTTVAEESEMVPLNTLNILQIAAALDMSDTAIGYFMRHHQVQSLGKHANMKTMPASSVLYNSYQPEGEDSTDQSGLFLRLLISWGRITTFISLLEGCRHNWTANNITEAAQVMIAREDWDFLERLLDMSTTIDIIKNASQDSRMKFHQTFAQLKEQDGADFIYQQYFQSGYEDICLGQGPWVLIPEEIEAQLIKTIDSDSIDELRELMIKQLEEQNGIKGLVQLRVNPILRCLEKGSLRCLQEITKRFSRGLREAMVGEKIKSKVQIGDNTYQFDNQAFAVMAANPNTQLLPFLLNQDGFIPTHRDLHNIILAYATPSADFEYLKKSQASLKLLLQSYRTHVVYASFSQNERQSLLRDLLKANSDPKLPSSQFLLDLISQRPYLKDSFSLILTQSQDIHPEIIHKIAIQSEQSLSAQDFYIAEQLLERGKIDESFIPSHIQEAPATALRSLIKKLNSA